MFLLAECLLQDSPGNVIAGFLADYYKIDLGDDKVIRIRQCNLAAILSIVETTIWAHPDCVSNTHAKSLLPCDIR